MKYSDLVENRSTDTEKQKFLVGGNMAAITIGIPENLCNANKEAASFSAFIRMCMIEELTKKGQ